MKKPIRYAVIGLGDISQEAVLPAFQHCKTSRLTALISGDPKKRAKLGRKYGIPRDRTYTYQQYEQCLRSGEVDAVYIALPNELHKDYTVRAAEQGIHVLCEKPMAVDEIECQAMIDACDRNRVKLMIAYRLHFEKGNLTAVEYARKNGKLGDVKLYQSLHSQAARRNNVRLEPVVKGGGPTFDIGVYDINAARYIFRGEPTSVYAEAVMDPKDPGIEESMSVLMRFPGNRMASILYSFGSVKSDTFRVLGTKGELSLEPAFAFVGDKKMKVAINEKEKTLRFKATDHFAAEIDYFSECVLKNRVPEPSGEEGMHDIRIIEAIYESCRAGRPVTLALRKKKGVIGIRQKIERPPVRKVAKLVDAQAPTKKEAA